MNYGKKKALYAASVSRINLMPQAGAQPNDPSPPSPDDGEDSDKESVKRKSRNMSEKKRRDQFNLLVNELCAMVSGNNRKMDKTSVLKSTISFLRIHNDMAEKSHAHEIREDWKPPFLSNDEFTQLMLEALDGFLLVATQGGTILFASESVTSLLNHLPSDLVNQSLYNFTHADERMKIYQLLSQHKVVPGNGVPDYEMDENQLQFTCHLKCGTTLPDEHCVYELVECTGNFRRWSGERITDSDDLDLADLSGRSAEEVCFCCTIRLKRSQLIRELSVVDDSKKEFTSRMSLEWSFLFLDHRGPPIIGYLPFEVLGTSGYDYYHPDDLENIAQSHEQLMQTGEGTSCHYRFLTKGQQWIWLQTRFYITYHQWNSKPEFIVCTNTVVSYAEVRNSLRERHVADNINAGNESLKSEINSPSNPDTTNNTVWILGTQTLPSPAPSRRSVTASDFSEVGGDTSEASKLQTQIVCPQYATALTSQISVQSPTEESADNIKSPISSILSAPTSALSREVNVSSQEQAPVSLVEEGQNTSDVALTPVQSRLKQQLLQKHQQLQEAILRQQEELKLISEQLNLSTPAAISSSHAPSIAGTPMILEHAIMPSIGTTSNSANLIPTAISTNSMIPVTPVTPIPMVLQPQQVVLSMPSGALLTAPVTTSGSNTSLQAQQDNAVNDPSHQLGQVRRRGNPP